MSTPKPHNDLPTLADKLAWKEELARLVSAFRIAIRPTCWVYMAIGAVAKPALCGNCKES
ncbi:MAG: hypothetical protein PHU06_09550 [Gallionella sp.]|nr:hypothetical protein [Gallionella sp.]MDD4958789.1 hypothetical protein [Gallionella sp.]